MSQQQFSLHNRQYGWVSGQLTSGTADQVIEWLQDWKKRNQNKFGHLVGKVVSFTYQKNGSWSKTEKKTIKVEDVSNGYVKGYDLSKPISEGFRSYLESRIIDDPIVFN